MWLRDKSEHCIHNSIEFDHMWTPCQSILRSCLNNFLCTVSTAYFSRFLAIDERSQYFLLHSSPIAIYISPWPLPDHYNNWYNFLDMYMSKTTVISRVKKFSPTEIPDDRHEQVIIGRKWKQWFGTRIGIDMKNVCTIVITSITINLQGDFLFRSSLRLLHKLSRRNYSL